MCQAERVTVLTAHLCLVDEALLTLQEEDVGEEQEVRVEKVDGG